MGTSPQTVTMPGQVWGVAAPGPDGPILATTFDGDNLSSTVLTALGPSGAVLWQYRAPGRPSPPRANTNDTVWIAHRGDVGHTLTELDFAGTVLRSVVLEHEPHEYLGAFVLLPDGVCAAWLPADRAHVVPPGRVPRVARHDSDGRTVWSTTIQLGALAHEGVAEASLDTSWQAHPKRPWQPRTLSVSHWQPLLVSADRIAATYEDYGSGIGVTFFLDTTSLPRHHQPSSTPPAGTWLPEPDRGRAGSTPSSRLASS